MVCHVQCTPLQNYGILVNNKQQQIHAELRCESKNQDTKLNSSHNFPKC